MSLFSKLIIYIIFSIMTSDICWATCLGLGCNCTVGSSGINFGNYNTLAASPNNSTGNINITCSALVLGLLVGYEIQLSTGSGDYASRKMIYSTNSLNYNIYTNPARTQIWGDASGGTSSVSDSYLLMVSPTTQSYTLYGQIFALQNVIAGPYSDNIVASVIF